MAPRRTSTEDANPPALQEIIFSCSICYALPSDVYATKEHNKGFHSGSGDEDGIVTRFWISECSHVFCGRHLENGAPPFHPQGRRPRAPCPVCLTRDERNTEPKELFAIRGLATGQYDPGVPEDYFQCPPIKLNTNTNDPGLDALKFQYSHISTYAVQVTKLWKADRRRRRALEQSLHKEREQWEKNQADLKAQVAELEKGQTKLRKWEQRKAMINHYLGMVGKMGEDIKRMRSHLLQLGIDVPEQSYSFDAEKHGQGQPVRPAETNRAYSSTTLVGDKQHDSSSSLKRKHRDDHYLDHKDDEARIPTDQAMMPPPLLLQRQHQQDSCPAPTLQHQSQRTQQYASLSQSQQQHRSQQASRSDLPEARSPYYHHDQAQSEFPAHVQARAETWQERGPVLPNRQQDEAPRATQGYGNSQNTRQIPLRPPHNVAPQQDTDVLEQATVYSQRGTYFSKPARRRSQQYYQTDAPDNSHFAPQSSRLQPPPSSRISHFNPAYGTRAQQSGDDAPRETMPPQRATSPAPQYRPIVTPGQRRPIPAESVVSPFFKAPQRPDTVQRPPARRVDLRQQYDPPTREGFRMQPPPSSIYGRPTQNISRGNPPPSSRGYQSMAPYREPYTLQDQFQRSASQHRERITLPPSSSRRDSQLSRIPGVRGGGFAPPSSMGRQSLAPFNSQPRNVLSAAGVRRSALR